MCTQCYLALLSPLLCSTLRWQLTTKKFRALHASVQAIKTSSEFNTRLSLPRNSVADCPPFLYSVPPGKDNKHQRNLGKKVSSTDQIIHRRVFPGTRRLTSRESASDVFKGQGGAGGDDRTRKCSAAAISPLLSRPLLRPRTHARAEGAWPPAPTNGCLPGFSGSCSLRMSDGALAQAQRGRRNYTFQEPLGPRAERRRQWRVVCKCSSTCSSSGLRGLRGAGL